MCVCWNAIPYHRALTRDYKRHFGSMYTLNGIKLPVERQMLQLLLASVQRTNPATRVVCWRNHWTEAPAYIRSYLWCLRAPLYQRTYLNIKLSSAVSRKVRPKRRKTIIEKRGCTSVCKDENLLVRCDSICVRKDGRLHTLALGHERSWLL